MLKLSPVRVRALAAAGTAAGFVAAYDAPIAAVLFVLEIVTGLIAFEMLLPVLTATALSTYLTRVALGETPLYGVRAFRLVSGKELLAYAVLGVLAGLLGPLFMAALDVGDRAAKKLALPRALRAALGALLQGAARVAAPWLVDGSAPGAYALPPSGWRASPQRRRTRRSWRRRSSSSSPPTRRCFRR